MSAKNFVVAIELGSTKIRGIAGQRKPDGSIAVLAVVSEDAKQCIRNGVVHNIDKTIQCITSIVQRLRTQLKANIKHVYVGVGGRSIHSERNTIVKEIHDDIPVKQTQITEMMDQNRAMDYQGMEILDVEVQEFRADALLQKDPVGVLCSRLEGNFLNILQSKRHYQNLNTCFDKAGVTLAEIYLAPFALADAVLTEGEKRNGCVLVDMGAETTTVMVYHKDTVRHIAVIPLGSNNITNDLASILQLDETEAEKLKIRYASAYTPSEDIDQSLKYDIDTDRQVDSSHFIDIVEGRVFEIIDNVRNQIPIDFSDKISGGIILTGGGANMKNMEEAFRQYAKVRKVRTAKFISSTVNSTNAEINAHDGTMNTLLALLAKGDQNCYLAPEEPKHPNMFEQTQSSEGIAKPQDDPTYRDPNGLPPGVVQTAAEKEVERKAQEEAKRKAQEEEEARRRAEEEAKRKAQKPGIGTKFLKWLSSITAAEE